MSHAAPDAPLMLVCGPDRRMRYQLCGLMLAGLLGALIMDMQWPWRLGLALVVVLIGLIELKRLRASKPRTLHLFSDGMAQWRQPEQPWSTGTLGPKHWISKHHAVIHLQSDDNSHYLLISRARQPGGQFRLLLSRLRHLPNAKEDPQTTAF